MQADGIRYAHAQARAAAALSNCSKLQINAQFSSASGATERNARNLGSGVCMITTDERRYSCLDAVAPRPAQFYVMCVRLRAFLAPERGYAHKC